MTCAESNPTGNVATQGAESAVCDCLVLEMSLTVVFIVSSPVHPNAVPADRHISRNIGKGSQYSTVEHRVTELIPVLGSQPAGDVSRKPGSRLPLLPPGPQLPSQP